MLDEFIDAVKRGIATQFQHRTWEWFIKSKQVLISLGRSMVVSIDKVMLTCS